MPDANDELLAAARRALAVMAAWGLDYTDAYAQLLAAVDAREREDIERAKATVVEENHAG